MGCGRIDKVQVSLSSPLSFADIQHIDICLFVCLFVCVPSLHICSSRPRSNILTFKCNKGYRTLIIDINLPKYIICLFQRVRTVGKISFNWLVQTSIDYTLV